MLKFRRANRYAIVIGVCVGILTLALLQTSALNDYFWSLQIVVFFAWLLPLFTPFVVGFIAVRVAKQTEDVNQSFVKTIYRSRWLLAFCIAMLPLLIVNWVYISIYIKAIFYNIVSCVDGPCSTPINVPFNFANLIKQTLVVSSLGLGVLGGNLLTASLGITLVRQGRTVLISTAITCIGWLTACLILLAVWAFSADYVLNLSEALSGGVLTFALLALPTTLLANLILYWSRRNQRLTANLPNAI